MIKNLIPLSMAESVSYIKNPEVKFEDIFKAGEFVDTHGVTKGKGFQGPVRRFGISLKSHKSEKGVRRPGTLGPWHPARVTFYAAIAGQTGFHSRVTYNNLILKIGNEKDGINKSSGFHRYGNIKTDYVLVRGSIQGPPKRALLLTSAIRPTREQSKKKL